MGNSSRTMSKRPYPRRARNVWEESCRPISNDSGDTGEDLRQNKPSPVPRVLWQPFKYTDSGHPTRVLSRLYKQWTEGLFLDVTVKIENLSIRAHKSVLCALSRYFEALFTINMKDSEKDVIELRDLNAGAVKLLIEFAYTGSLNLTQQNVQSLLSTANYLCIEPVIENCCKYLEVNLTCDNCIDIFDFATSLDQHKLQKNIAVFMSSYFEELVRDGHLLKMPVEMLAQVLENDNLEVLENGFCITKEQQEVKVLQVVSAYIEARPEFKDHLPQLLSRGIRLLLLPPEEELKSCHSITPECLKLVSQILSSEISKQDQERWRHPRFCAIRYEKTKKLATIVQVRSEVPTKPFDDGKNFPQGECVYVSGMAIYIRRWDVHRPVVGGIKVFYSNGQSVLHGSAGYGYENDEFHLGPGERIVSINARVGWMIDQLQFHTNLGNVYGPYGGPGGNEEDLPSPCDGAYLAYLTGTVDTTQSKTAVRKLRFVWGFHQPQASIQNFAPVQ